MSTNSIAASPRTAMEAVEEGVNRIGRKGWRFFHALPGHGALIGASAGLAGAIYIGVAELAAGLFAGYVTYRMFAYGETFPEAIQNCIKVKHGELSRDEICKPVLK